MSSCDEKSVRQTAPVAVVIPTYNRGAAIFSALERIKACEPGPAEIWIHIDLSDGALEHELSIKYPDVSVLTSASRIGPGGGRHQCLLKCRSPYAASFDDDSFPIDVDFFETVCRLFLENPRAGILGARVQHRG